MTETVRVHRGVWAAHPAGVEGRAGARHQKMVIAQAVKHQGADLTEAGVRGDPLHGLDRGPSHQPGTVW
jgi:hypothetical protein